MSARTLSGRSPWIPICGAALAVGLVYLAIFSVPPLITTFVDELGLSYTQSGALMSVCLGAFLLSSLVSGRAVERFGPVPVIVSALVLCGAGTACFGLTDSLGVFFLCRAAIGIGGGLVYAPGVTFVSSLLPPARVNIGIGVFLCGLSVGGTVAFFATRLLSDALDWRWPSWIFGAAVLVGAVAVHLLSSADSPRPRRHARRSATPVGELLASRPFRVLLLSLFVALFVAYGIFTWIPPYLDDSAGFSTAEIGFVSALMTLAGIPATFAVGLIADRSGRPLATAAAGLALPVLLVVFAVVSTPLLGVAILVSTLAALGISGGLGPLYALPPVLFGTDGGATASGLAASAAMGGAVASTYFGGWVVGATDGYSEAFGIYTVAAAATALGLVPLVAVSLRRARAATARER